VLVRGALSVPLKIVVIAAAVAVILSLVTLGLGVFVGKPRLGRELAESLGVPHPAVIAHRGAAYDAPEETRPAFLLARELGADYLELDVQRTKDGVLIAFHDDDLRRTTNVAEVFAGRDQDPVDHFTFAELQQLDAGSWFNTMFPGRARASFKGLKILRLEEVMDIAEGGSHRSGLYVETKSAPRYPGIEQQLVATLAARGWISPGHRYPARVIFQSFHARSLALLKTLAPQIPAVLLIDETMMATQGWPGLLQTAKETGAGIGTWGYAWSRDTQWAIERAPRRYMTTWPWYTGQAHAAGLLVHPWTVDSRWEMWMVSLSGVDGFFTNRADLALAFYGKAKSIDPAALWLKIGY